MTDSGYLIVQAASETVQLVTFTVGDMILGIDIAYVQEINRHLDVTEVPEASPMIHGVVNLRGDVVTVLDPHKIFGIDSTKERQQQRNLILNVQGERIGVLVDQVSDILTIRRSDLSRKPSNSRTIDAQFIDSVYLREDEVVVILNPCHLIDAIDTSSDPATAVA